MRLKRARVVKAPGAVIDNKAFATVSKAEKKTTLAWELKVLHEKEQKKKLICLL